MTTMTHVQPTTTRFSMPNLLLRAEGLAAFIAALAYYQHLQGNWWMFALLLLSPDLAMVGYLVNTRVGAIAYNAVHTYIAPLLLVAISLVSSNPLLLQLAVIWMAHIGMDRVAGYGLKYTSAFKATHLDRV